MYIGRGEELAREGENEGTRKCQRRLWKILERRHARKESILRKKSTPGERGEMKNPPPNNKARREKILPVPPSPLCFRTERRSYLLRLWKTNSNMFRHRNLGFEGPAFEKAKGKMGYRARRSFRELEAAAASLAPQRWLDTLTAGQEAKTAVISSPDQWEQRLADFTKALEKIPVLGLSFMEEQGSLSFVAISTFEGHVAIFCIGPLCTMVPGWLKRADVLPPDVRVWLQSERFHVLVAGQAEALAAEPDGMAAAMVTDTESLFDIYKTKGIIKPVFDTKEKDLAWQLTLVHQYHHRPTTKHAFRQLVGANSYEVWPAHRKPGWKPEEGASPVERFFLFHEAAGVHAFVNHLLRWGLVYGGMRAVLPGLPLKDLFVSFLGGAAGEQELRLVDPLRLVSDRPTPDEEWDNAIEGGGGNEGGEQELELEVSEEGQLVVDEDREELEEGELEETPEEKEDLRKLLDEKKAHQKSSEESGSGPPSVIFVPPPHGRAEGHEGAATVPHEAGGPASDGAGSGGGPEVQPPAQEVAPARAVLDDAV